MKTSDRSKNLKLWTTTLFLDIQIKTFDIYLVLTSVGTDMVLAKPRDCVHENLHEFTPYLKLSICRFHVKNFIPMGQWTKIELHWTTLLWQQRNTG